MYLVKVDSQQILTFFWEYINLYLKLKCFSLQLQLLTEDEELKSLPATKNENVHTIRVFSVQVTSHGKSWVVRRSYENFEFLDRQAHQCIFNRKNSLLPVIPQEENVTPNNGQSHKVRLMFYY